MYEDQVMPAAHKAQIATRVGDLDQQIAQQDATIQTLERRLAAVSGSLHRFSCSELRKELAMETELSAALEERGTLLYDRNFVLRQA